MSDDNEEIELECPKCSALVPYECVEVVDDDEGAAGCPECGESSPTDDWFC